MRVPSGRTRLALLPLSMLIVMVLVVLLLLLLAAGSLAAPFSRRRPLVRMASFGLVYCGMEIAVVAQGLTVRRGRSNDRLLEWALATVLGAGRRILGFEVKVESPGTPQALASDGPVLVLARHGGPGDSFSLAYLLEAIYGRRVRIVAKDILQLDPALDLLLNRRGCCFVESSRDSDNRGRLATCASRLGDRDALLLFPEGENWTPRRRARALRRLRERRRHRAARAGALMENVLPPRPSGVAACLRERPDIPVLIAAHSGLDRIVTLRQLWRSVPFRTPMTVRFWPAQQPPAPAAGEEAVAEWLTSEWAIVDQWIDSRREAASQPAAAGANREQPP